MASCKVRQQLTGIGHTGLGRYLAGSIAESKLLRWEEESTSSKAGAGGPLMSCEASVTSEVLSTSSMASRSLSCLIGLNTVTYLHGHASLQFLYADEQLIPGSEPAVRFAHTGTGGIRCK